jgi:uncharacterized protein (UPF0333 family)
MVNKMEDIILALVFLVIVFVVFAIAIESYFSQNVSSYFPYNFTCLANESCIATYNQTNNCVNVYSITRNGKEYAPYKLIPETMLGKNIIFFPIPAPTPTSNPTSFILEQVC